MTLYMHTPSHSLMLHNRFLTAQQIQIIPVQVHPSSLGSAVRLRADHATVSDANKLNTVLQSPERQAGGPRINRY